MLVTVHVVEQTVHGKVETIEQLGSWAQTVLLKVRAVMLASELMC